MKNKSFIDKDSLKNIIVEKESLYTIKNGIMHFLCLIVPVAAAFIGYFASEPVWTLMKKELPCPQWFCFLCSMILFIISVVIIFVKTRNTNSIIRIRVSKKITESNS